MTSKPNIVLRQERGQRGWSQQQLAQHIGTTAGSISRWERGVGLPNASFLRQLCECFGKDAQALGFSQNLLSDRKQKRQLRSQTSLSALVHLAPSIKQTPLLFDPIIPVPPTHPLIGRAEQLTDLRERLLHRSNVALNGLPGVGKTALLIALAHDTKLHTHFADGILWASLGPHPNVQSHLSRWGSLLGLSSSEMSTLSDSEAWAVALHRAIGSRTMLLIIDDIWTLEDALLLKVGGSHCSYLVSTRFPSIATQMTVEGAKALKELNNEDGLALLRTLAPKVVENEAQRAYGLVIAVGGLPLALHLIGNYLRRQAYIGPARRVDTALQKLNEVGERLNISEPRGPSERHPSLPDATPVSLRTIIAVTDQQFSESTRSALYALAVFPPRPNSFSEAAALAVAACDYATLDEISNTGLLETNGSDRYSLHQTIIDYARLQLTDNNAHRRLITYIASFVETYRKDYEILEIENNNIIAALEASIEHTLHAEIIRIAVAFAPFLLARGLYENAKLYLQRAYDTAIVTADHFGLAGTQLYLGEMAWKQGNFMQAEQYLQEGLKYAREVKNDELTCTLLAQLGSISWRTGDYQQAEAYAQQGLLLARQLSDISQKAMLLDTLGAITMRQGNYIQSEQYLQEGLEIARQVNARELACSILTNLGVQVAEQGNYTQAERYEQEGLELARQVGNHEAMSLLLNNLGDMAAEQGRYAQAEIYFQEGLELARNIHLLEWMGVLLVNLGLVARKQGQYDRAEQKLQESLGFARQINVPLLTANLYYEYGNLYLDRQELQQAEETFQKVRDTAPEGGHDMVGLAYYGLARTLMAQGKEEEALQLGKSSAQILEMIGHRGASEVKIWLASIVKPH